jgi:hypothetical protein
MLVAIAAMTLGAGAAAADPGTLTGTVTNAADGTPIEGAMLVARGNHGPRWAFSDASGAYVLENLREGEQMIRCWAIGFMPVESPVTIVGGDTTVLDFALETFAFGQVQGIVTDAVTGEPIPGAWVRLRPAAKDLSSDDQEMGMHTVTGPDGAYLFEHVIAGEYAVSARAWGYLEPEPVLISVAEDEVVTADLSLDPVVFGGAEGTVTDAVTGAPIEGARVFATPYHDQSKSGGGDMGHGRWHTTTDADGYYMFEQLVARTYTVFVMAPGYVRASQTLEVLDGEVATLDFALDPMTFGAVEGTVSDAVTGEPIEGALALVFRWGGPTTTGGDLPEKAGGLFFARTDENGFFQFEEVPVGTYQARFMARGYLYQSLAVEVQENQVTTVDVQLAPRN